MFKKIQYVFLKLLWALYSKIHRAMLVKIFTVVTVNSIHWHAGFKSYDYDYIADKRDFQAMRCQLVYFSRQRCVHCVVAMLETVQSSNDQSYVLQRAFIMLQDGLWQTFRLLAERPANKSDSDGRSLLSNKSLVTSSSLSSMSRQWVLFQILLSCACLQWRNRNKLLKNCYAVVHFIPLNARQSRVRPENKRDRRHGFQPSLHVSSLSQPADTVATAITPSSPQQHRHHRNNTVTPVATQRSLPTAGSVTGDSGRERTEEHV